MPVWADILLALGAAIFFGLIFAVIFAFVVAGVVDRAKMRFLQPHLDQLARDLAMSQKVTEAARARIRRVVR